MHVHWKLLNEITLTKSQITHYKVIYVVDWIWWKRLYNYQDIRYMYKMILVTYSKVWWKTSKWALDFSKFLFANDFSIGKTSMQRWKSTNEKVRSILLGGAKILSLCSTLFSSEFWHFQFVCIKSVAFSFNPCFKSNHLQK